MRLPALYGIVGLAGGLLAGAVAGLATLGFAAGAGWLFLFGDSPWPAWSGWLIYGPGLAAGLGVGGACLAVAIAYGIRAERGPAAAAVKARRLAYGLLALIVAGYGACGLLLAHEAANDARLRAESRQQNDAFAGLLAARHRIAAVDLAHPAPDRVAVTVALAGTRRGRYGLDWQVRERTYRKVLDEGALALDLSGNGTTRLDLDLRALAEAYRDRVLSSNGAPILVDESLLLDLVLTPVLSEAEGATLSAAERQNLRLGDSALIDRRTAKVPVRFLIRGGAISLE